VIAMEPERHTAVNHPMSTITERLRELYEGDSLRAHRFRYGLFLFDLATILFIVVTSFLPRVAFLEIIDVLIGIIIAADVLARLTISRNRIRDLLSPVTWADLISIASFLAPITGEAAGFLRIVRTLRFLRTYHVLLRLRQDVPFFRENEALVIAVANLVVFIFVMTGVVYASQHLRNPAIGNYADALYFTVTALTTTGFGDITLPGTTGRMISVVIMIFGVTLFLRLAQVLFRPNKVRFPCPTCGLQRHDYDAVHCKACGQILNIPNEDS
jgi:voltage-gated potassium channel